MYVQVHVSQCRRTCNQIWTVAHVHAGNYESVRSVNCGVELQRKILETCPCFLFSCFMYLIHFISTFLVLLPRVTSWWRTTYPLSTLGPERRPLSDTMSKRFHGVRIQHSARLICTSSGHTVHIQYASLHIEFQRRPVGSLTPLTIDVFICS